MDAIAAGKNVLRQKAFTPDTQDAEVIMTAKAKRVLDGGYVDSVHPVDADVTQNTS